MIVQDTNSGLNGETKTAGIVRSKGAIHCVHLTPISFAVSEHTNLSIFLKQLPLYLCRRVKSDTLPELSEKIKNK